MIDTRKKLKDCLTLDSANYRTQTSGLFHYLHYNIFSNPITNQKYIWLYIKTLRYCEYHINTKGVFHKFAELFYLRRLRQFSYRTGFQIPPNVCGPGLTIYHYGPIIINSNVHIGCNCTLYPGVLIGWKGPDRKECAIIGDHVFIGSGTKIIGGVHLGNHVTIAPGSIVIKDIEDNTVVGGSSCRNLK